MRMPHADDDVERVQAGRQEVDRVEEVGARAPGTRGK